MDKPVDWTQNYKPGTAAAPAQPAEAPLSAAAPRPTGGSCIKGVIGLVVAAMLVGVVGAFAVVGMRNGLIEKNEAVKAQWSDIDTQLQRRVDLIPNLVNTVKGYAKHEEEIFKAVSDARSKLMAAGTASAKAAAGAALDGALGRLLAISESYPQLKANENFIRLQDELAGTENRIAVARARYNETVKVYNASIRKFPGSYFAAGMELKAADYFQPPAGSKAVQVPPTVQF